MTSSTGSSQLYVKSMDQLEAKPVPGTAQATTTNFSPFFSPDGQWIGYWINNRLKKVAVTGGAPLDLCETPILYGASWPSGGTILFGRGPDGIWQVAEGGGQPSQRIAVDPRKEIAFGPQLLPDGKTVLFAVAAQRAAAAQSMWDDADIVVQGLDSKTRTVVVHGGSDARYLSSGYLAYVRKGTLLVVPFDQRRNAVVGSAVPVLDGIRAAGLQGALVGFGGTSVGSQYAVSETGLLAYVPASAETGRRILVWVDRQGRETPLPAPPRGYTYPRISPEGTRIAIDIRDEQQGIWMWDLGRETLSRVTFSATADFAPLWSPDGHRIVFSRQGQGMFVKSADGAGTEEQLAESGNDVLSPNAFTKDGAQLIFASHRPQGYDLRVLDIAHKHASDVLAQAGVDEMNADLSPDGRWIAYQSNESGQNEIYVRPYPDVQTARFHVSRAGGTRPRWSGTGKMLYSVAAGSTVMGTPITVGSGFQVGAPTKLFSGPYVAMLTNRTYDVSPDERLLMIKNADAGPPAASQIIVVENWFQELSHLVAAAR